MDLQKTVRNNRENISNFIYNTYNLPETTFQKFKVSDSRNKFHSELLIQILQIIVIKYSVNSLYICNQLNNIRK